MSQRVNLTQYQHQHEAYHPQFEQAHQQESEAQGEAQEEQAQDKHAKPQAFLGSPTDLSLILNFDRHVACRLWRDVEVSIIV